MGLSTHFHSASRRSTLSARVTHLLLLSAALLFTQSASAQLTQPPVNLSTNEVPTHTLRTRKFLGGRTLTHQFAAAPAMTDARKQQIDLLAQQAILPHISGLNAAWQPLGPGQVASIHYGNVTGRVTAIAIDPSDASGNTVYLGTTGGGVWKSTNAAGPAASVTFTPLTDTLPVYGENAGISVIPSLSIGAISVQSGVVLAGTGDSNDATDSFYGSGILRSADGGLTWTLIQQSDNGASIPSSFIGLGFAGFAWSSTSTDTVVAASLKRQKALSST